MEKNQTSNLNSEIEDVLEHFVYVPKKSTVNPQDIPFFLSTRLVAPIGSSSSGSGGDIEGYGTKHLTIVRDANTIAVDPAPAVLSQFEALAAEFANEFEDNIERY